METPSSTLRRQTRSQARKGRQEEAPERSALLDITNDSPVVGLKVGGFAEKAATPSSAPPAAKVKAAAAAAARTPGSGEALLRKQVKFLLQKVEEESELVVGVPPPPPPPTAHGEQCCPAFRALISHLRSPAQLLAPTPANTPVLKEEDAAVCETVLLHLGRHEVEFRSAVDEVFEQKPSDHHHVDGAMISRALQFDSPQKTETTCNSPDGSCSSAWSLQVNCSSKLEEEDDDEVEQVGYYVGEEEEEDEEEEEEEEEEEWFDVLCEGMKKVSLLEEVSGKHTRFVYDSDDDEITGEEEEVVTRGGMALLKGMPVPQGKHIRFQEEEEEEA